MSRGVMLFNPYTGKPRDPRDIASDPQGLALIDPDEPLRPAAQASAKPEAQPVAWWYPDGEVRVRVTYAPTETIALYAAAPTPKERG